MIFNFTKNKLDLGWHKWFAWYPVEVSWDKNNGCTSAFLHTIWRRWIHDVGYDDYSHWEYALEKPENKVVIEKPSTKNKKRNKKRNKNGN